MGAFRDIAGQKFGRLTAVRATERRTNYSVVWECLCDCGKTALVPLKSLGRSTKSCGCLHVESAKKVCAARCVTKGVVMTRKEARKRGVENLLDHYVAETIRFNMKGAKLADIPRELLDLQRQSLLNKRLLRKFKKTIKEHMEAKK